jgi:hypothetical protein
MDLNFNQLTILPESIGNLPALETLDLHGNQFKILPESIGDLSSLKGLYLNNNKLKVLPKYFWDLKSLENLNLQDNLWEGEWKGIEQYTIETVLQRSRQISPIIIFISFSKDDKKKYRMNNLKQNLKGEKEILEVHINGEENISKSQLLLFIATKNSTNDEKCFRELRLANSYGIGIIPIKGADISFNDLSKIDLGGYYQLKNKLGFEFDGTHCKKFCNELYEHIKKYKREVNVFKRELSESIESEQRQIEKQWETIKLIWEKFIESNEFQVNIEKNSELFKKLLKKLKSEQITPTEYFIKWSRILKIKRNLN